MWVCWWKNKKKYVKLIEARRNGALDAGNLIKQATQKKNPKNKKGKTFPGNKKPKIIDRKTKDFRLTNTFSEQI